VCTKLRVSMDGASPKTFNVLRAPSDFDDVVGRLRLVAEWRAGLAPEERPTVLIESTMMSQWIDELPAMVRLAKELRVDGLGVAHVVAYNEHWERSHMRHQPAHNDAMFREAAAEARRLGLNLHLPKLFTTGENLSVQAPPAFPLRAKVEVPEVPVDGRPTFCHYLWREAFISIDGDVAPCCGLGRPVVGNLRKNPDLRAIFQDPVLVGMRAGTLSGELHPACAKCPQLAMFGNVSYADASFRGTYAALADHRKKKQERAEKPR
jgi:MoaA/NifB/PqqE/SkfB family radical SAM enzyme